VSATVTGAPNVGADVVGGGRDGDADVGAAVCTDPVGAVGDTVGANGSEGVRVGDDDVGESEIGIDVGVPLVGLGVGALVVGADVGACVHGFM
jgi:hypothetical protein